SAQTTRAERENTLKDIEPFVSTVQCQLVKTRSEKSIRCAIPCSLYFLSAAMPRKVIDTLHHAGMCLSYNITMDLHAQLADGQMERAESASRRGHGLGWDNEQISTSGHVEQRTFAPPKVQTGTAAIVYDLLGVDAPTELALPPILDNRAKEELITFNADIK
ncbi:hypothetical protein R3P38DRAFT_2413572, partial [Favolaschia claudopus]